jgi:hypothetical protein
MKFKYFHRSQALLGKRMKLGAKNPTLKNFTNSAYHTPASFGYNKLHHKGLDSPHQ